MSVSAKPTRARHPIGGLFALCAIVVLAGCGSKDAEKTTAPAPVRMVYPAGILTTADTLPGMRGIYPVPVGGGEKCCWVTDDVRFFVPVPDGAKTLQLDVILPSMPGFVWKPQSVTELDPAGKSIATRPVPLGPETTLRFPLPPRQTYGLALPVHLRLATAVVPRDVGFAGDIRRLGLIVTGASAR